MSGSSGWISAVVSLLRDELSVRDGVLREDDAGSTCKEIQIKYTGKRLVLSFNAKIDGVCIQNRLFPLFRPREGIGRMCDYWIICEHGAPRAVPYVFLCELKSGNPRGLDQLENGQLLAKYVVSMVAHHEKINVDNVEYRGLIFSPAYRANKAGLTPGKCQYIKTGKPGMKVAFLPDEGPYRLEALCS